MILPGSEGGGPKSSMSKFFVPTVHHQCCCPCYGNLDPMQNRPSCVAFSANSEVRQAIRASKNEDFPHPFGPASTIRRAVSGMHRTVKLVNRLKFLIVTLLSFISASLFQKSGRPHRCGAWPPLGGAPRDRDLRRGFRQPSACVAVPWTPRRVFCFYGGARRSCGR